MKPNSRIIQILSGDGGALICLCQDGSIWQFLPYAKPPGQWKNLTYMTEIQNYAECSPVCIATDYGSDDHDELANANLIAKARGES